jgi:hypothetical protein
MTNRVTEAGTQKATNPTRVSTINAVRTLLMATSQIVKKLKVHYILIIHPLYKFVNT